MTTEQDITLIYDRYGIPHSLRSHLYRVAGIARLIADHWTGPTLDCRMLDRVLLLHDIGNIVKIDLNSPVEEGEDLSKYAAIQEQYWKRFGKDDHLASKELSREIGLTEEELRFMDAKVFVRNEETRSSPDHNLKIAAYADQRVAPTGIQPLIDRLREAQQRYRDKPGSSMNNPRTEFLIGCAIDIEMQVMTHCTLPPSEISDERVSKHILALKEFRI